MTEQTNNGDRYLEKSGRVYRWNGQRLYIILAEGSEKCIRRKSDTSRILLSGVDISKARAMRIVELVPTNPTGKGPEGA